MHGSHDHLLRRPSAPSSNHTVLPSRRPSTPQRLDNRATRSRPRPLTASAAACRGTGRLGSVSSTSTRTWRPSIATRTVTSVWAWRTAFVTSSDRHSSASSQRNRSGSSRSARNCRACRGVARSAGRTIVACADESELVRSPPSSPPVVGPASAIGQGLLALDLDVAAPGRSWASFVARLPGCAPFVLHLRLEHVANPGGEVLADGLLQGGDRREVVVVELLDELERPPPIDHVAAHVLALDLVGELSVTGFAEPVDGVTEQQVGAAHQLVPAVEVAACPDQVLVGLAQLADRGDGGVVDTRGAAPVLVGSGSHRASVTRPGALPTPVCQGSLVAEGPRRRQSGGCDAGGLARAAGFDGEEDLVVVGGE